MVIPAAINKMNEGRRILCFSNLKSRKGGTILFSRITKIDNEIADTTNEPAICRIFWELTPICMSVRAIRNDVIVTESAPTPLMSIGNDARFLLEVLSVALPNLRDESFYLL